MINAKLGWGDRDRVQTVNFSRDLITTRIRLLLVEMNLFNKYGEL